MTAGPAPEGGTVRSLLKVTSTISLLSAIAAGCIGAVATLAVGGPLAMGAAIYLGNTEPTMPHAPYPTLLAFLALVAAAVGAVLERKMDRTLPGAILSHAGAVAFALLPFVHLYRLWAAT